jgi:hypothetical protein
MCKCVDLANQKLAEHNTQIEPILVFSQPEREAIGIRTSKVDRVKRGQPKTLLATFCPFCGEKL